MSRVQVYLPEDLHDELKRRGLPASELLQVALRAEVERLDALEKTEAYLAELETEIGEPGARLQSQGCRANRSASWLAQSRQGRSKHPNDCANAAHSLVQAACRRNIRAQTDGVEIPASVDLTRPTLAALDELGKSGTNQQIDARPSSLR